MNKIILASTSPRRKELLEKAGIDFQIDASSIEEIMDEILPLEERLIDLAISKGEPIHQKYPYDIVISADTIVYYQDQVIGKPKDEQDARVILEKLSQSCHSVYTAVAIYFKDDLVSFVEQTDVYFKDISFLLDDYMASKEWIGKAGGYAIQGRAGEFIDHIVGDRDNVIGLPLQRVVNILKEKNAI